MPQGGRQIVLGWLVAALLLIPAGAVGQSSGDQTKDKIQQCIDAQPNQMMPRPCTFVDGKMSVQGGDTAGQSAFATFVLVGLLWVAVPLVAAGMIASSRGQSVGLALLITLILGWIGLLIVWLAFKPEVIAAGRSAVKGLTEKQQEPVRRDPIERMTALERLRDSGAITSEEFEAKRRRILDEV